VGCLAAGRLVFTREEAQAAVGINRGAFLDAAEKLRKRDSASKPAPRLLRHRSSPVPEFRESAARIFHRRPDAACEPALLCGLVEGRRVARSVSSGGDGIPGRHEPPDAGCAGRPLEDRLYSRKDMPAIASGIEERKTDTGKTKISSVELTLLDLLRYPQASAGLDNISTVFPDLGPTVDYNTNWRTFLLN